MDNQLGIKDIVNYDLDKYITDDDVSVIKNHFKDPKLIKVLRKVLLPSANDLDLPVEDFAQDMWMVDKDFSAIPNEEVKTIVLARQDSIKIVIGGLIKLKVIANQPDEETTEQKKNRTEQDSTQ